MTEDKIIRPLVLRLHGLLKANLEQQASTAGTSPTKSVYDSCETYIQLQSTNQ